MIESLEQIIADLREDSAVMSRVGDEGRATYINKLLDRIRTSDAEDFLLWLSEDMAFLKSGLSRRTLRRRFRELMDCGLARYDSRRGREYRSIAIPPRPDAAAAKAAGLAGEPLRKTA